jgi:endonuclease III
MVAQRAPAAPAAPARPRARPAPRKPSAALRRRALAINTVLTEYYDTPTHPEGRVDPLSELIAVVLSQHTSDVNSERAFNSLRARYPDWESVRRAPTPDVADAIRSGGLAVIKAARIQRILDQILEARGALSLDFLDALSLDAARAFLRGLDGVGPKSAACVLLFSLDKPAMPVDTHVHRVAGRLGLIPRGTSAEAAHEQLERMVPPEEVYRFHVNLIWHGRKICKASRPRCAVCPVNGLCPYPSKTL